MHHSCFTRLCLARICAEPEGILVDICCSAKGAANGIDLALRGDLKDQRVVFLHTGGASALGGYGFGFEHSNHGVNI